jgi:hypothetical protein
MLDFLRTKNVDVRTYPEQRRRRKKMTNVFYMELNDLNHELERSAEILRVLAHPVRLQIVHQLVRKQTLNCDRITTDFNITAIYGFTTSS